MTTSSLSAEDVALFLQNRPDFFDEHAEVFANLRVPHPHEARAISLGERQIMTLRSRTRDLEWKLSGLVHNASGNQKIGQTLNAWCAGMLAENDAARLPERIVQGLSELFDLPGIALRTWGLSPEVPTAYTQGVTPSILGFAAELEKPRCGPFDGQEVVDWLAETPASLALIPLRAPSSGLLLGLLVLASDDADRFGEGMGTTFLETIAQLAGAALSRLSPQEDDNPEIA